MEQLVNLLPLLLLGAAFYFLIMRPQKNRQRAQRELEQSLQPGARVMTTAGIFGTIATVSDDEVGIEVAPGVILRHLPAAVAKLMPVEPTPSAAPEPAPDPSAGDPA